MGFDDEDQAQKTGNSPDPLMGRKRSTEARKKSSRQIKPKPNKR
jgi:hypothetical protein